MNTVSPTFSVIIPTFNRAHIIKRAVESVLAQTYHNFELIIVDDCSTDSTGEVLSTLNDSRIRYIQLNQRSGAAAARNEGVRQAKSHYIAFQDSDDVWRVNKLQKQYDTIQAYDPDVCFSRFERTGYITNVSPLVPSEQVKPGFVPFETILEGDLVGTPTVVAKREVLLKEPFDENLFWCEDYEWTIRAGKTSSFYYLNETLVDVYLQRDSVTVINPANGLAFYKKILADNQLCNTYPAFKANMLSKAAKLLIDIKEDPSDYLLQAFRITKSPKDFIKCLLSKMGLISYFIKPDPIYLETKDKPSNQI